MRSYHIKVPQYRSRPADPDDQRHADLLRTLAAIAERMEAIVEALDTISFSISKAAPNGG